MLSVCLTFVLASSGSMSIISLGISLRVSLHNLSLKDQSLSGIGGARMPQPMSALAQRIRTILGKNLWGELFLKLITILIVMWLSLDSSYFVRHWLTSCPGALPANIVITLVLVIMFINSLWP